MKHRLDAWWEDCSLPARILVDVGFGVLGIGLLALCTIPFKGMGSGGNHGRSNRKRQRHLRRYLRDTQSSAAGPSPAAADDIGR